jgi:archaellum component FlaC
VDDSARKSEGRERGKQSGCLSTGSNRQMSEMLGELINLKSEYKMLKANYAKVANEKKEEVLR